jgi:sec-independent protein translocase protein TatB
MFDVGFSELALIFGVSLVVLGPKRLPGLVSKVGRWVGKARAMARDFQQQLEHEVNLEELNKITERVQREAQSIMPTAPPDAAAESPLPPTPTYPYSSPDTPVETASVEAPTEQPTLTDDTYSHAHAEGDAPMPDVQEFAAADAPAAEDVPMQADLDLSPPDDDSHLPPDDARRYS